MDYRKEFLSAKLKALLARRTPPPSIRTDEMQAAEATSLLDCISRYAPRTRYDEWWPTFEAALLENVRTRSWPTVGEVKDAALAKRSASATDEEAKEAAMADLLEKHFRKTGKELASCGSPSRTDELIKRGVLADVREARFRGFALSEEQNKRAKGMRAGHEEWAHHVKVVGDMWGIPEYEARAKARELAACDEPRTGRTRGSAGMDAAE